MMAAPKLKSIASKLEDPPWMTEILQHRKRKNFSVFLVHGNTEDLFIVPEKGPYSLRTYISKYIIPEYQKQVNNGEELLGLNFHPQEGFMPLPSGKIASSMEETLNLEKEKESANKLNDMGFGSIITEDPVFPKNPGRAFMNVHRWMRLGADYGIPPIFMTIYCSEMLLTSEGWKGSRETNDLTVSIIDRIAHDREVLENTNNILLLLTLDDISSIHPSLRKESNGIKQIFVDYPTTNQRSNFLMNSDLTFKDSKEFDKIIINSAGCSLRSIRSFVNNSKDEKSNDSLEFELLKHRKEFIQKEAGGILTIEKPQYGREVVGGLDYVFELMDKEVYPNLRDRNPFTPSGILFTGPPGTGKSITAETIAYECGLPFINFQLENAFYWFVGASERNMDRCINIIKSVAPCIVWMDEIDQIGMQRGGYQGDSGVSSRVFKRLLEFLGDDSNHGQILFMAASNEPKLIDAAMRRSGRFDLKIPFLPGDTMMRSQIFQAIFNKYETVTKKVGLKINTDNMELAKATPNFLGSDIEGLLKESFRKCVSNGKILNTQYILDLVPTYTPSVSEKDKKRYIKEALEECNTKSYLPKVFKEIC